LARRQGLDLSGSFAYGDHEADIPLLSSVGRPVAVNPRRPLAREARRRGWPIEYF
jgi:alcohol-forming fatty acyl-CoA reductase